MTRRPQPPKGTLREDAMHNPKEGDSAATTENFTRPSLSHRTNGPPKGQKRTRDSVAAARARMLLEKKVAEFRSELAQLLIAKKFQIGTRITQPIEDMLDRAKIRLSNTLAARESLATDAEGRISDRFTNALLPSTREATTGGNWPFNPDSN